MEHQPVTIAVDGFSSCGKSTLAKALAEALGYGYVDSGAMYRAVTYYFLENAIDLEDGPAVLNALKDIRIEFRRIAGANHTFLNDVDVELPIRGMEVSQMVSPVATLSPVRRAMVALQKAMGLQKAIVMDGRDIGTVVFPDAELKIFLTAGVDVRAQRRFMELQAKGDVVKLAQVKDNLIQRDHIDSTRLDSPLIQASDAVVIDNTNLTEEEQLAMALALARIRERWDKGSAIQ